MSLFIVTGAQRRGLRRHQQGGGISGRHLCSSRCCRQVSAPAWDTSTSCAGGWKPQRESHCSDLGWGHSLTGPRTFERDVFTGGLREGREECRSFAGPGPQEFLPGRSRYPVICCLGSGAGAKLLRQLHGSGPLLLISLSRFSLRPHPPTSAEKN